MFQFRNRTAMATLVFKPQREWVLQDIVDVLRSTGLETANLIHSTRRARSDVIWLTSERTLILISRTNEDQVTLGIETTGDADTAIEALIKPLSLQFALDACIWAPKSKTLTLDALDVAIDDVRHVRWALPRPIRSVSSPVQDTLHAIWKFGSNVFHDAPSSPRTDP